MMRATLTILAFVSAILFPWPLTALLALGAAALEPLVPLAIGIFADTLYYAPQAQAFPIFSFFGALATALALFVHSRLKTGTIGR